MFASKLRLVLGAAVVSLMLQAHGQSSSNFQVEGGRITSSSASATPASAGFRAEGGMDTNTATGLAASANFAAASGLSSMALPQVTEIVFRNGFEN